MRAIQLTCFFTIVSLVAAGGTVKSTGTKISVVAAGVSTNLTSIKITNLEATAKSRAKFTFAVPLKQGAVSSAQTLVMSPALNLQVDKKAFYSDGSLKHAIVSGEVDLAGNETKTFTLNSATAATSGEVTLAQLMATSFDAIINLNVGGTNYSLSARDLLQSGTPEQWLKGPLVSEWIVGGSLKNGATPHPTLAGYFHVRVYAGLEVIRVDFVVENGWYKEVNRDIAYTATLSIKGQTVYTKALNHYAEARWHKIAYVGSNPNLFVGFEKTYLQNTKSVPLYAAVTPSTSGLLQVVEPLSGGVYGANGADMANAGDSLWIGPLPSWDSIYVNSGDLNSFRHMIAGNESAAIFGCPGRYIGGGAGVHLRDKLTGTIVSVDTRPNASAADSTPDNIPDCVTSNPYLKDSSHQPLVGYTPYLVTGDYYFLEEMAFWNAYNIFEGSPSNHAGSQGLFYDGQIRGTAWSYRSLGFAAFIFPDSHKLKSYFVQKLKNNIAADINKVNTKGNLFGTWFGGGAPNGFNDYPTFMDDFLTWAIGHVVDLGFSEALPLLAYKSKFVIGRMGGTNGSSNGYCFQAGSRYRTPMGPSEFALYANWADVYKATTTCTQACGTTALSACLSLDATDPNAMTGYQDLPNSNGGLGYYAQMQPALAMAVQYGYGTLADHWAKFRAAKVLPNYSVDPRFGIIPRSAP